MKLITLPVLLLSLFLVSFSIQKSADFGEFEISFGGEPKVSTESVPTDIGDIEMTSYMYEKSADEVYMVAISEYPAEHIKSSSPSALLEGAQDGASRSLKIENWDKNKEIKLGKNIGKEFSGNNGNFFVNYKIYLVGNKLYQVAILKVNEYTNKKTAKNFFSSFKLK